MVLSAERKSGLTVMEFGAFLRQTQGAKKGYKTEDGVCHGQQYTIFKDKDDPNASAKAKAVHKAVEKIVLKGVAIPAGLKVYCTSFYEAQNRAFSRDSAWNAVANVILGPAALVGGRADALSGTGAGGCNKPTITCIHEIGHVLHAHGAGDAFFETDSNIVAGPPVNAGEVSGYAAQNKKEFIAEVFAGLILGITYSPNCMQEYTTLSGPVVP
jgi:hypothetical protein